MPLCHKSETHNYKLTYFDTRGRAEVLRLLFAAAGQKFEDVRVEMSKWGAMKSNTPWGSLPVLEVDGQELAQTPVAVHYVANQHGLGGSNPWEQALIDSAVAAAMDLWSAFSNFPYMPAGPQKDAAMTTAKETTVPNSLGFLDKFIAKHGKDGFTVGNKLTSADVAIFNCVDQLTTVYGVPEKAVENFSHVKATVEKTRKNDKIAAYLKTRK